MPQGVCSFGPTATPSRQETDNGKRMQVTLKQLSRAGSKSKIIASLQTFVTNSKFKVDTAASQLGVQQSERGAPVMQPGFVTGQLQERSAPRRHTDDDIDFEKSQRSADRPVVESMPTSSRLAHDPESTGGFGRGRRLSPAHRSHQGDRCGNRSQLSQLALDSQQS